MDAAADLRAALPARAARVGVGGREGILIAYAPTRPAGLALGALVCLAVFATLIRHRGAAHLLPGAALFGVIPVTAFGVVAVRP